MKTGNTQTTFTTFYTHTIREFVLGPSTRYAVFSGFLGVGMGLVLSGVFYESPILIILGMGLSFMGGGGILMLRERLHHYRAEWEESRKVEDPPVEPDPVGNYLVLDLGNGFPEERIWEPRRGTFRAWCRTITEDTTDKIGFSFNQAKVRGWDEDNYSILILKLKGLGVLHQTELHRDSPKMTVTGRGYLERWVNGG